MNGLRIYLIYLVLRQKKNFRPQVMIKKIKTKIDKTYNLETLGYLKSVQFSLMMGIEKEELCLIICIAHSLQLNKNEVDELVDTLKLNSKKRNEKTLYEHIFNLSELWFGDIHKNEPTSYNYYKESF